MHANTIFIQKKRLRCFDEQYFASSLVVILANPAHQTALNARKRLIQAGLLSPLKELNILNGLISGVKDCAKQSAVWAHRRWIFRFIHSSEVSGQPGSNGILSLSPSTLRSELALVSQACEIYPRNYHGWNHWHACTECLFYTLTSVNGELGTGALSEYRSILDDEMARLFQWIDRHVSDHTAIHCLCDFVRRCKSSILSDYTEIQSSKLTEHCVSLLSFYPDHESLWMYLRACMWQLDEGGRKDLLVELRTKEYWDSSHAKNVDSWYSRTFSSTETE